MGGKGNEISCATAAIEKETCKCVSIASSLYAKLQEKSLDQVIVAQHLQTLNNNFILNASAIKSRACKFVVSIVFVT